MNFASLARSGKALGFFALFGNRPPAPQTLASVLRGIYSSNASPKRATVDLLSAMKQFPLESRHFPPGDVEALNITLRQTGALGLQDFHHQYHEARSFLANQPPGPLKNAIAKVLGDAFLDCHNAELTWGSRMMRAHSKGNQEILALATVMLGDKHRTVAHVEAALSGTLIPRLHTAQQTCEAVQSEAVDIWEQAEPLNDDMEAESPELPAAHAEGSPSRQKYPQDPSIERLLRERESRSRPRLNFLKDMLGIPAA